MTFIEEKKWTELEEISPWKNPASYQMAVIAKFYRVCFFKFNGLDNFGYFYLYLCRVNPKNQVKF